MIPNKYAPDFGRISLWIDERPNTETQATGKVQLFDTEGNVIKEVNVYLYANFAKQSDRSPDYYGFLKDVGKSKQDEPQKPRPKSLKKAPKQADFEETFEEAF